MDVIPLCQWVWFYLGFKKKRENISVIIVILLCVPKYCVVIRTIRNGTHCNRTLYSINILEHQLCTQIKCNKIVCLLFAKKYLLPLLLWAYSMFTNNTNTILRVLHVVKLNGVNASGRKYEKYKMDRRRRRKKGKQNSLMNVCYFAWIVPLRRLNSVELT